MGNDDTYLLEIVEACSSGSVLVDRMAERTVVQSVRLPDKCPSQAWLCTQTS